MLVKMEGEGSYFFTFTCRSSVDANEIKDKPKLILCAKRYEALSKARTQHKDKTAVQLGRLADKVISEYAEDDQDTSLAILREELNGSADDLAIILKDFYGLGDMAADIFRRRMQKDWEELYPCVI